MGRYTRRCRCRPVIFAALYPQMVRTARRHGYALALHGSLVKDMDVIAIPWTDKAVPVGELAKAIAKSIGAYTLLRTKMPHGRVAISMHYGAGGYIDFSATPRRRHQKRGCSK